MNYIKILFALFCLSILAVIGFSYWIYSSLNAPHSHEKTAEFIKIEKGTTPNQIIDRLSDEGILAAKLPVQIYIRTIGNSNGFQAGEFQFPSPITPLQVLKELEKGEERTTKLTIPEGFTRFGAYIC